MFEVTDELNWKIREKRAKNRLSMIAAARQIGICRQTFKLIESGERIRVRKTVYEKLVNWLINEKMEVK